MFHSASTNHCPVAVGGVGGSGSRLIAQLLMELGHHMGDDLNDANDNLWFTLLFKRLEILSTSDHEFEALSEIFINAMTRSREFSKEEIKTLNYLATKDRIQHPAAWLKSRAQALLSTKPASNPIKKWGWKEPNTHIVIDRLTKVIPDIKYIHVVRNGLDMAYSANQNQLQLWGGHFIGEDNQVSACHSLRYWCIVHRRILTIGKNMGAKFLFLNFDRLCQNPENGIKELLEFLQLEISPAQAAALAKLVKPPASIGRFKQYGIDIFDPEDIIFLQQLGFDISPA